MNNPFDVDANAPITEVKTDAQGDDPGVTQFREGFAGTDFHLLQPLHPEVNYSFGQATAESRAPLPPRTLMATRSPRKRCSAP